MLELPPNIRIGYRDYRFEPMTSEDDPEDKHLGFHNGTWGVIKIDVDNNPPYPKNELINTVFHEILHGICNLYHARFGDKEDDFTNEEYVVSFMGDGLTQVFNDNPQFIEWMLKHCPRDINERTSSPL